MSIELKLDGSAVKTLFPAGSEVRLQLQQCVIEEITKRFIYKEASSSLIKADFDIKSQINQTVSEVNSKFVSTSGYGKYETYKLKPEFKRDLEKKIQETVSSAVTDILNKEDTQKLIETRIGMRIDSMIQKIFTEKTNEVLKQHLSKTMDSLTKQLTSGLSAGSSKS